MNRHLLVVCTANVCRSPVAQQLLRRRFGEAEGNDGRSWSVASAGVSPVRAIADPRTAAAAAAVGLDLAGHQPRPFDLDVLRSDGADLVLTMTRAQLRHVVALDTAWWPRTFTIKELVRRGSDAAPATSDEDLAPWLARVAAGRRAADLIKPDPNDDVADPYGAPRRAHEAMVHELATLVDTLLRLGPWSQRRADG